MTSPDRSSMGIRPAALRDLETLTAIDARCFPPGIAYRQQELASLLSRRTVLTLVAERDGSIAAFASVSVSRGGRRRHRQAMAQRIPAELITIDVLPEFRREGLGRRLHHALTGWLRAGGWDAIELHVAVDNAAAIAFYDRLGYRQRGRVTGYYPGAVDAWRMLLALDRGPE